MYNKANQVKIISRIVNKEFNNKAQIIVKYKYYSHN